VTVTRWVIYREGEGYWHVADDGDTKYGALSDACLCATTFHLEEEGDEWQAVSVTISPVGAPGGARERVAKALDVELAQTGWEGSEDIVTCDGHPIGGTVDGRYRQAFDRWWPALQEILLDRILAALNAAPRPVEALVEIENAWDAIIESAGHILMPAGEKLIEWVPLMNKLRDGFDAALAAMQAKEEKT